LKISLAQLLKYFETFEGFNANAAATATDYYAYTSAAENGHIEISKQSLNQVLRITSDEPIAGLAEILEI
jgi:uncharacterized Fe-S cluster-containing radical SAM superfamily protein